MAAAGQESQEWRIKFTQAIRRKRSAFFVLTVLHDSFTVNQKRGPTGTGFHWSLAIGQGKSASSSKCQLGSPPHAWAHSHAEAERTRNSPHPAANIQPASRCGSVAWRTLTSSVSTAWASAGSAARPLGITHAAASDAALAQQVPQAFAYSWPAPNIAHCHSQQVSFQPWWSSPIKHQPGRQAGSKGWWLFSFFFFLIGWKQKCWGTHRLTLVLTSAIRVVPENVYQYGDRCFIYIDTGSLLPVAH